MSPLAGYPTGIGDYEIRGVLGSGASGTVYLAYQKFMDRRVALKELSAELTADPIFRERFRAEAEVLARLDDDHCVRVFDYFQRPEHDYLVTELVEGASLRAIVQHSGPLTPQEALGVVRGALLGLAHAHELGLLHRDIKPENILVDTEGTSKLADFGQAAIQPGPGAAGGMPAGSPAYMSPEMVAGGTLDARSDVYSMGAVLFELLTGQPPFVADSPLAVMRMQREAPVPDPQSLNPALGAGVAELVHLALAKDPVGRPASAGEMLAMLESRAVEAYGADWESRSSLKRRVAAAEGAGLGLLANLGAATAAAGVGLVGSAVVAEAGPGASAGAALVGGGSQGVFGAKAWALAGAVAAVLVLGGVGAYAATHGFLGGGRSPAATRFANPVPSASLATLASPTPDASASAGSDAPPTPTAGPSPTRTGTPTPSGHTTATPAPSQTSTAPSGGGTPTPVPPGPIVVPQPSVSLWYIRCHPAPTCDPAKNAAPAYDVGLSCGSDKLEVMEKYSYSYLGGSGPSETIKVHWTGYYDGGILMAPKNQNSQVVSSGQSNTHQPNTATAFAPTLQVSGGVAGGNITFTLSWTNPNGSPGAGATSPGTLHYSCT